MEALFQAVNAICGKIQIVSNLFWDFPTNFDWYAKIPILGNFSLAIILLVGTGIYFTFRLRFIQVRKFRYGLHVLMRQKSSGTGISSLASFLLSTAMRVGPGNILGVTGAISTGGPGALFWMWISAFFGMSTAFVEATLSQIFKERKDDEYVGGLPFYGRRLLKNAAWAGAALSVLYIIYAFLCFPAQGFNTISAVGAIAGVFTGTVIETNSSLYWISFAVLIVATAIISFGGIKKVTKVTDLLVPVMAVIYILTVVLLIVFNIPRIPWFFGAVFSEAFRPEAVFGGAFGIALSQGIKRGLMSNEAGQGTITMPAAAADANHPCDQGCVQALGVFLDTIVICSCTAMLMLLAPQNLTNGLTGMNLLQTAMNYHLGGFGVVFIAVILWMFSFSTFLGILFYARSNVAYLFGDKWGWQTAYKVLALVMLFIGGIQTYTFVWDLGDVGIGLMTIFNIFILYAMSGQAIKELKNYEETKKKSIEERAYALQEDE